MKRTMFILSLSCLVVAAVTAQGILGRNPRPSKVAEIYNEGSVSRDGHFFSYWNWDDLDGNLFVRDLKTGKDTRLTDNAREPGSVGESSVIAPDNKRVAYAWFTNDGATELRTVGIDGSGTRSLYRVQDARGMDTYDWSPDGVWILTALRRTDEAYEIVLISSVDNWVRTLKVFKSRREASEWKRWLNFSPDGRYIAYDFPPQEGSPNHDIFALALDGGPEVPLVEHPANDRLLGWAPDGRILFASNRGGKWGAWAMPVADGKSRGAPELVRADINPFQHGLGFTLDGSYYYGVSAWENDVYLATLDPTAEKISSPRKLVGHVGFGTSVEWSPDGQSLAYVSGAGWLYDPFVLGVLAIETGKKSGLQLSGIERWGDQDFQPHWSPDGRFFLASGDVLGLRGFYRIDARTGEVNPIVSDRLPRGAAWSPDGKTIFTRMMRETRSMVIATRDPTTGQEKELYRAALPVRLSNLAVSPDARRLAFVSSDEQGGTTIEVVPTSGSEAPREVIRLPARANSAVALAWTPNSRDLIYARGVRADGQKPSLSLWLIWAQRGEPRNLGSRIDGLPYGLSVHPDGQQIAFTAGTGRRVEVWLMKDLLR